MQRRRQFVIFLFILVVVAIAVYFLLPVEYRPNVPGTTMTSGAATSSAPSPFSASGIKTAIKKYWFLVPVVVVAIIAGVRFLINLSRSGVPSPGTGLEKVATKVEGETGEGEEEIEEEEQDIIPKARKARRYWSDAELRTNFNEMTLAKDQFDIVLKEYHKDPKTARLDFSSERAKEFGRLSSQARHDHNELQLTLKEMNRRKMPEALL